MADSRGHLHADFRMAIETDAVPGGGRRAKRGGFADIVQEYAPGECRGDSGGQAREHQAGMNPDVALGMILGGLRDTFHGGDFGQELQEQAGIV